MAGKNTDSRPNILIVIMDAARADHISAYGYGRKTSPNLDALAARGVLYEQCISPASWTLESMSSLFTGLYPSQHGTNFAHQYLEPRFPTMAEVLRDQGYQTAMFATVEWVSDLFGLNRGFEHYTNYVQGIRSLRRFFRKTTKLEKLLRLTRWYLYSNSRGKMTHEAVRDLRHWFEQDYQPERPFFAVAHLSDPHWPWFYHRGATWENGGKLPRLCSPDAHRYIAGEIDYSPAEQQQMVDYYDGEIRFLDAYLGRLFNWLETRGLLQNTLLIVTADHGEELKEHRLIGHGWSVYEPELHVPLVLHHPQYFSGGQRVGELVQSVDVFPTVLDLIGMDRSAVSQQLTGLNLRPEQLQANPRPFSISERVAPSLKRFERTMPNFDTSAINRQLRALRMRGTGEKLIWGSDGCHEVYDLIADPQELVNLAERDPERLQKLLALQQAWLDGLDVASLGRLEQAIDGELAERLQDLGYL